MAILVEIQTSNGRQNYSARPITLSHDGILTNGLLRLKRGTLEMQIAVSREQIAQRAGELLAHTYVPSLDRFSVCVCVCVHTHTVTHTAVLHSACTSTKNHVVHIGCSYWYPDSTIHS
jgi:hypothetical protein